MSKGKTFKSPLAKENGITQLEATIYNYMQRDDNNDKNKFHPLEGCLKLLADQKRYFLNAPFYAVLLYKMWTTLTDTLQNTCCVVFSNLLQYAYWGNQNTGKITGIQFPLPQDGERRDKLIKYALSTYSLNNLPVNYLEIKEVAENQCLIRIEQKCYICLLYTSPSPRDRTRSRMPSSA